jgi:dihydrolipoamide dehydrogenase
LNQSFHSSSSNTGKVVPNKALTVIGGGPGGYVAAIRASQLGFQVTLVEAEHLGGICLNWGCIPTKALLHSAETFHLAHLLNTPKIDIKNTDCHLEAMVKRSRKISGQLSQGIDALMKKNKISVIKGHAKLAKYEHGMWHVAIAAPVSQDGTGPSCQKTQKDSPPQYIQSENVILATGARARMLPGLRVNEQVWTYKEAMVPKTLPKSMIIIGSGAIGIEFASFYRTLGCEVSVIEIAPRILLSEDWEIAGIAQKQFEKQGIRFFTSTTLQSWDIQEGKGVQLSIQETKKDTTLGAVQELAADVLLLAIGIVGNTEHLGLESTGVILEKNHIVTQDYGYTGVPGLYAIGDVADGPWLAHKASHEGVMCVEHIAGMKVKPLKKDLIPGCIYSSPQMASVGWTQDQALGAGRKIRIGKSYLRFNGKALAIEEPEGLIKTIFDETTGELLGAHMIGAHVTEMIQGYVIAKTLEATEEDLAHVIFPHPTLSEAMHESVLDSLGQALHG